MLVKIPEKEKEKILTKYLNYSDYLKGKNYYKNYIKRASVQDLGNNIIKVLTGVESERTMEIYRCSVKINRETNEILNMDCNCMQFSSTCSCKHLGAFLYYYFDQLFEFKIDDKTISNFTKDLFKKFNDNTKRNVKEEVHVEYELTGNARSIDTLDLALKIGTDKLYKCSNGSKLKKFLRCVRDKEVYEIGKNFTYDPDKCYFSKENKEILEFLIMLVDTSGYYYYNNDYLSGPYNVKKMLFLLQDKKFTLNGVVIKKISTDFPFKTNLILKDNYRLKLNINKDLLKITTDYEYIQVGDTLYHLDNKKASLVKELLDNNINELIFDNKDKGNFVNTLLPVVKDNIEIDSKIDDIKITNSVKTKLYFDLSNMVICNVKFLYDDVEIDYFDNNSAILRDKEYEDKIVNDICKYGFTIGKNKIYLEDIDMIGKFLEEDLLELTEKYETYTSENLKKVRIVKDNNIKSTFSIGMDNILSYSFDLGNIKEDEIVNVLESLKNNKKYYRLKSGDILDLDDASLEEFNKLTQDMELSKGDLKNKTGVIPKYRAIYLDSLKGDKYHIIETNNLFDDLIDKFNKYKDSDIKLTKKDLEILREYQVDGVKWLVNIDRTGFGGILADEMGLGKSIQTIYYIKELLKESSDYKFLIVSPTSLAYNWENEFNKFGKGIKYKVIAGVRSKRREDLESINDTNVLITTYGLLREDKEIYDKMHFKTMIIDEAQNIKNVNTEITKTVKSIKADTKFALTGTPIENSILELWSIFDFIMPGFLASLPTFDKKYKIKDLEQEDDNNKISSLNKLVSPFIMRRRKKDVIKDLPDKIENNIYVDLTNEQKKLYLAELEKVNKELEEVMQTEGISKARFLIFQLLTKLRQICIDPRILFKDYKGGSGKLEEFVKVVKEMALNGHKILVFTSFRTGLELAKYELLKEKISSYIIDGSVSSKKRMELVDKFNNDNTNVFFIMLKAGGTGLNLTSADVVIHLDLWWNPQAENQATDRAHRIGQKKVVQVIHFITKGTIEEKILDLQSKKKLLSDKLLDSNQEANVFSQLSEKDIKDLLSYDNSDDD